MCGNARCEHPNICSHKCAQHCLRAQVIYPGSHIPCPTLCPLPRPLLPARASPPLSSPPAPTTRPLPLPFAPVAGPGAMPPCAAPAAAAEEEDSPADTAGAVLAGKAEALVPAGPAATARPSALVATPFVPLPWTALKAASSGTFHHGAAGITGACACAEEDVKVVAGGGLGLGAMAPAHSSSSSHRPASTPGGGGGSMLLLLLAPPPLPPPLLLVASGADNGDVVAPLAVLRDGMHPAAAGGGLLGRLPPPAAPTLPLLPPPLWLLLGLCTPATGVPNPGERGNAAFPDAAASSWEVAHTPMPSNSFRGGGMCALPAVASASATALPALLPAS